jgi:hypothetical protein
MDHSEKVSNTNVFNWFRICQLLNIAITVIDIGIHIFLRIEIINYAVRSKKQTTASYNLS